VARFRPGEAPPVEPLRDWARGDAQQLGRALGGALSRMEEPLTPAVRFADPPYTEPDAALYASGAILVDEDGKRLDRDGVPLGRTPAVLAARRAYTVFGGELAERMARPSDDGPDARDGWRRTGRLFICTAGGRGYDYLDDVLQRPGCGQGDSPAALGAAVRLDGASLAATIDALNAARAGQTTLLPIARPPYYALGPLRPRLMLTHGGLRVDAAMQVLGADGAPLSALFAAGNAAAAIVSAGGHGYGIGWAIISGRRAGQSAARAARTGGAR
jgi:FAD binding domain